MSNVWEKKWTVTVKTDSPVSFHEPNISLPELPAFVVPGHRVYIEARIEEKHSSNDWGIAYTRQGQDDLRVYKQLRELRENNKIKSDCHELHYLQMASEKISKGWLLCNQRGAIENHRTSHVVFATFWDAVIKNPSLAHYGKDLLRKIKPLGLAIEYLAPAVNRDLQPQNVEYPWSDGTTLRVPLDKIFLDEFNFDKNVLPTFISILDEIANALIK